MCVLVVVFLTHNFVAQNSPAIIKSGNQFKISAADKEQGISGEMKVALDVNAEGKVTQARVFVGPGWPCNKSIDSNVDAFMRTVEKWVSEYTFKPEMKDGKPVATRLALTVKLPELPLDNAVISPSSTKVINGGVINGKAKFLARPAYPSEARSEGASGNVNVQVIVDEAGKVIWTQAVSGHPLLMFSSRDAACSSKFSKTTLGGQPVKVMGVITYLYSR